MPCGMGSKSSIGSTLVEKMESEMWTENGIFANEKK